MSVFSRLFSDVFNACTKLHKFSSFKKGMQAVITDSNCGIVPKFQFFCNKHISNNNVSCFASHILYSVCMIVKFL